MQQTGTILSSVAMSSVIQRPFHWVLTGSLVMSMVLAGCSTNTPAPITDIHILEH